jgi:hypothetical protein
MIFDLIYQADWDSFKVGRICAAMLVLKENEEDLIGEV